MKVWSAGQAKSSGLLFGLTHSQEDCLLSGVAGLLYVRLHPKQFLLFMPYLWNIEKRELPRPLVNLKN